jgi:hypothetical protein
MNTTTKKTFNYQVVVAYPLYNKEVVFEQGGQGYGSLEKSAPNGGNYSGENGNNPKG